MKKYHQRKISSENFRKFFKEIPEGKLHLNLFHNCFILENNLMVTFTNVVYELDQNDYCKCKQSISNM